MEFDYGTFCAENPDSCELDSHVEKEAPVWTLCPHPLRVGRFTDRHTAAKIIFSLSPLDTGVRGPIVLAGGRVDAQVLLDAAQNVGFIPHAPPGWVAHDEVSLPGLGLLNVKGAGGVVGGNTKAMGEVVDLVNGQLEIDQWVVVFVCSWDLSFTVVVYSKAAEAE